MLCDKMSLNSLESFNSYWNYYIELENELLDISKYIPIDKLNKNTFSFKYMKLIFSICSELDTVFKEFMEFKGIYKNQPNMNDYKIFMRDNFQNFSSEIILCNRLNELKPFENWDLNDSSSLWWKDYNDIKHYRTKKENGIENFKKSTQLNTLYALSALYQLETYLYRELVDKYEKNSSLKIPLPQSKIFRIKDWPNNRSLIDDKYLFEFDQIEKSLVFYAPDNLND